MDAPFTLHGNITCFIAVVCVCDFVVVVRFKKKNQKRCNLLDLVKCAEIGTHMVSLLGFNIIKDWIIRTPNYNLRYIGFKEHSVFVTYFRKSYQNVYALGFY